MFKLYKTIKNSMFLGHWDYFDYFLEDGFLKKKQDSIEKWVSSEKGGGYLIYNPKILVSGSESLKCFSHEDGSKIYENLNLCPFYSAHCNNMLVDNTETDVRRLSLFNINEQKILWTIDFKRGVQHFLYDKTFFVVGFRKAEIIFSITIQNGEINWELNLNEINDRNLSYKIKKNIGVWKNELLLGCTNHLLLSIDVNTGEELRRWQELKGFDGGQEYKDVLPEPSDFVLDKESGKLIGVFSKYYFEIDLTSGEISYEDIRQELKQHNINSFRRMGKNTYTKEYLFVTAHADLEERPNVDLDCVLALNRNTKKVDWVHFFKDTGIGTNVPQITDTHLYQLDTEGTLHIFEKE